MPKISLSKIKVPKSQTHSAKAEADATIPKTEGKGDDSIQIPDIERSHSERTEEGAQISIKLADVKIPTLGFSKIETGASQTETGVSSAKTDAALPPSEGSFQQVVLKSSSADEDTIQKTSIRFPKGEPSVELRSPETVTEKSSAVDGRNMKLEGPEGKIKMPEFQKPKFGISLTKGKGPETEITSPKIEAELPQLKMTNEFADIAVGVPASELTPDMSDPGVGVCKIKTPQVLTADIETPKVDISPQSVYKTVTEGTIESLEEKESKLKEHEIKAEEVPTEEHQGWFKMPKFRIPAFGRASLKEKKGDADTERSMEKAQAVAEITIGKEGIQKLGDSVKSSDVSLPKMEGDILLSTEGTDSRVNIPKTETYADIVRDGAEGHKMHTSEFTVESSTKLETSGVGLKPPSAEITLDALQEKIDVSLPKEELGIQNQEAGFEDGTNLPKSEADSASKTETGTAEMQFQKTEGSIGLDHVEASTRTVETMEKSQGGPEVNLKIPKLKIPKFTFKALPTEADGSTKSKILTLTEPDIKTAQMTTTIESALSDAGRDIHWSYVEGQEVSEKVEPEHVAIERCEIYTTEILKESEILSSEVKTPTLGFSLLKVKLPESHSNLEVLVQEPSFTESESVSKPKCADESFGVAPQRTGTIELKLSDKPHSETEELSGEVRLPKVKTFAVEVKPSSKFEESLPDKSPEEVTAGPLPKEEGVAEALEDEEKDITNEKEKTDSKRSPGRFKFWLPSIGFSSSGDEASTDSKTEVKKSLPEDVKPADASDIDSSKQAEKTGWFRFPKLGFTSPSKKAKTVDKEEMGHKEGRISDEDSPSDKPDVFFDAQESLSPKETTEGGKVEIDGASSNVPVSKTIVTSSARTELILLEKEKDSQSNIPRETTK
uniref:Protein AHNAK2 n=1 Tax=Falco tinnunculus TaxID=100819 RepID=A0A8C4TWH8_FALTI